MDKFVESYTVISLLILVKCFQNSLSFDYCDSNVCNKSREHTMCKYEAGSPGPNCNAYERTILQTEDKLRILEKLNRRRNIIASGEVRSFPSAANMKRLLWNEQLALFAQRWADQCSNYDVPDLQDSCRDLESMRVGQNIATVIGDSPGMNSASLVDIWYMQLLDINPAIISNYKSPTGSLQIHQNYFTQLVWAETFQVGCGGVKFRENFTDFGTQRSRSVHRLVCNFAPRGNIDGVNVYEEGIPCSKCPVDSKCDEDFTSLCGISKDIQMKETTIHVDQELHNNQHRSQHTVNIFSENISNIQTNSSIETENYPRLYDFSTEDTQFFYNTQTSSDDLSQLLGMSRHELTTKPYKYESCKNAVIDELVNLLKERLKEDEIVRIKSSNKTAEETYTDVGVEDFIRKLYRNKFTTPTTKTTANDILNSTLLVNLVEAVIFRNTGKYSTPEPEVIKLSTDQLNTVKIVPVQVELASVTPNNQFDGHYFFPEEVDEPFQKIPNDTNESYYESNTDVSATDILAEIDNLRMKTEVNDFLYEILETEDPTDPTTTSSSVLSPDKIGTYKDGYNNMRRFLEIIGEKKPISE